MSAWLPMACAVHCALAPLFVAVFPILAGTHRFELAFWFLSVGVAFWTALPVARRHGDRRVWAPIGIGATVWLLSVLGALHPLPEPILSPVGGVLLATGLLWNARTRHRDRCPTRCGCPLPHGDLHPGLSVEAETLGGRRAEGPVPEAGVS